MTVQVGAKVVVGLGRAVGLGERVGGFSVMDGEGGKAWVVVAFILSVAVAGFSVRVAVFSGVIPAGTVSVVATGRAVKIGSTNDSINSTTGWPLLESGRSITSRVGAASCSSTRLMGAIMSGGKLSLASCAAWRVNSLGGKAPKPPVAIMVAVIIIVNI